jgi:hypothetical protein
MYGQSGVHINSGGGKSRSSSSLNDKRASVDSYIPSNKRASLESLFGKRSSRCSDGSVEKGDKHGIHGMSLSNQIVLFQKQ